MNAKNVSPEANEERLVRLYMGLTGTSESSARSVFMFVGSENAKPSKAASELARN